MEGLRGHTSGFGVPTFVVDAPGGGGKIPLGPNYLLSMSDHRIALRNFEGYISIYEEPTAYPAHDPAACVDCRHKRVEPGQAGVSGLLDGDELAIEPKDWAKMHTRGGAEHRLNRDSQKWSPRGIGSPPSSAEEK